MKKLVNNTIIILILMIIVIGSDVKDVKSENKNEFIKERKYIAVNGKKNKNNQQNILSTNIETVDGQEVIKGELLIKYKNKDIKFEQENKEIIIANEKVKIKKHIDDTRISVVKIEEGETLASMMDKLKQDPSVESVEPNFAYKIFDINSNDTNKTELWGLDNIGQTVNSSTGVIDADIDFPKAMDIYNNQASPIVAVIDTGVMYDHPDLQDNMISGNGYDFANDDDDPYPNFGESHGTHVAGTIAATYNNNEGVVGVAPDAKIMALNVCENDYCYYLDGFAIISSVYYAADNGAKVINASFGGANYSQYMYDAISYFGSKGGLFIAAAGNNSEDSEIFYPSSYDLDNIITVAATDNNDNLASFSNYGVESVDIGAPGVDILSTIIQGGGYEQTYIITEDFTDDLSHYDLDDINNWRMTNDSYGDESLNGGQLDAEKNYLANENVIITSEQQDLTESDSILINIGLECDTEISEDDYLALEVSADGITFNELARFNEMYIGGIGYYDEQFSDWKSYQYDLDSQYFTNTFKLRFRWVSDNDELVGKGCNVDYIYLKKTVREDITPGYDYYNGTSMATPHVSGLAALLWSQNPELNYSEVKGLILNNGDDINSLNGKTITGKRINAFNSLQAWPVTEITPVATLTNNPTPSYTFSSTKAGNISYEGDCLSTTVEASEGENTIIFNTLSDNIYDNCRIIITDEQGNTSSLIISKFAVDTINPIIILEGDVINNITVGDDYIETKVTAIDNIDGDITSKINISGDTINTNIVGTYKVHYNVQDNAGNDAKEVVRTVIVNAPIVVNHIPTDISLGDIITIDENQSVNSIVGTLTTTDIDTNDKHTYSLDCYSAGVDDVFFNINNNELRASNPFDYEIKNYYNICIKVDDGQGGIFEKNFIIYINDLIEKEFTPIFRLYNTKTGAQLYTKGIADRDKILNKFKNFEFTDGVPAFYASIIDDGTTPIFRLYNTKTGAQLYTKGIADRDKILNKFKNFEFTDGVPAFYASIIDDGTTTIFRLYNTKTGAQLYTKGIADRDKILNKFKNFEFTDGVPAFYLRTE